MSIRGLSVLACAAALTTLSVAVLTTPASAAPSTPTSAAPAAAPHKVHTARSCGTPTRHHLACFAIKQVDPIEPKALHADGVTVSATPSGYGPVDLRSAYALTASGTASQTVAIIDAYDDPNAESDLATYRSQYGLPACTTANGCFKKVNINGATSPLPTANTGWAVEISLDVDMVSAICPNCHILLVEADDTVASLGTAVNRAVTMGAKFVSNSYGGPEDSTVTSADSSYFNHPGVAITAASGDDGYDGGSYPATSKYVTAVGGTSLARNTSARHWGETVWGAKASKTQGSGSGCSKYIAKPAFQNGITTGCTTRAESDVSAVADPLTGVAVYNTYGASGWGISGGTSASAPIIASIYALAGNPNTADLPNTYPYAHTANLNDVTSGGNGTCGAPMCTAGTGWDGPTGLGTPNGTAAFAGNHPVVTSPGSKTGNVGTAITAFTVSASGGVAPYTWSATGLPPGVSINSSTGTVSGTPTTTGTYTATVTATGAGASVGSGSATFSFLVGTAGCASPGQKLGNPGFEAGNTVWTASSGVIGQNGPQEAAHGGSWDAWLDGNGITHTDTVSQSVVIPAGCKNSTLSFYLHIDTAETTTTAAYDTMMVKIGSTTLATYSNLNAATGYTLRSFPVGSYAGSTITVTFTGTEDSSLQTSFVLDDTALTAS